MTGPVLAKLLSDRRYPLTFNIVEVGALPLGQSEPFHEFVELFPGSRISAFELDPALCAELNARAKPGMRYYTAAVGRAAESRTLYVTAHPMCSSLYAPDERYADLYNKLDVQRLKSTTTITTTTLDQFAREHAVGAIDFIKMDIQGAELDVLQGATAAITNVVAVLAEVGFVPIYKDQPLYGDVDAWLRERDFAFHHFPYIFGRTIKPLARDGMTVAPAQMMWADAFFTRNLLELPKLATDQMLKLAVLLDLYEARDAALHVLGHRDTVARESLAPAYLELLLASGKWTKPQ